VKPQFNRKFKLIVASFRWKLEYIMNLNMKTLIFSVAVTGAMVFGATKSAAALQPLSALVKLSPSGTIYYSTNSSQALSGPLIKVSYNTKTLIALLNASASASNAVFSVTSSNQIPSTSFFLFDPYAGTLALTNKGGFFFPLKGSGYDFGRLIINQYQLIGTYSLKSTLAGKETDRTSFYFDFSDGADLETSFKLYGAATLTWTYGAASGSTQTASVKVSMSGISDNGSQIKGNEGVTASFSASGSGSVANEPTNAVPFFNAY
jgi:hypothetical protein